MSQNVAGPPLASERVGQVRDRVSAFGVEDEVGATTHRPWGWQQQQPTMQNAQVPWQSASTLCVGSTTMPPGAGTDALCWGRPDLEPTSNEAHDDMMADDEEDSHGYWGSELLDSTVTEVAKAMHPISAVRLVPRSVLVAPPVSRLPAGRGAPLLCPPGRARVAGAADDWAMSFL